MEIMTFLSLYCYYKTLFHVVLLRCHGEIHYIIMNLEMCQQILLSSQSQLYPREGGLPQ